MPNSPFRYVISSKHLKKELIELNTVLDNCEKLNLKVDTVKDFRKSVSFIRRKIYFR